MQAKIFEDRWAAGRALGQELARRGVSGDLLVLGLPRGGVPVAVEVAAALGAPVDVLVVRKLGAPFNPELALGAVAFGGLVVYNDDLLAAVGSSRERLAAVLAREREELERRESVYRPGAPPIAVAGKVLVLVDDGMATGATMHAAVAAARKLAPQSIVVAVPTAAAEAVDRLARVADRVVALEQPEPYFGVGAWYAEFPQLTDVEVLEALAAARRGDGGTGSGGRTAA
jgi:putative phosphoribosyl transferase